MSDGDWTVRWQPTKASAMMLISRWARSRAPIGVVLFAGVLCWYDVSSREMALGRGWWVTPVFIAAWTGLLLGYDYFDRLRGERALRLMLLRPGSPAALAAGALLGGAVLAFASLLIPLLYVLLTTDASAIQVVAIWPFLVLASIGFVAFALAASVALPRDTAAVLGVVVLFFGAGPSDRWLPMATPEAVRVVVNVLWQIIPTSYRVTQAIEGVARPISLTVMVMQIGLATFITARLLNRRALLARGDDS